MMNNTTELQTFSISSEDTQSDRFRIQVNNQDINNNNHNGANLDQISEQGSIRSTASSSILKSDRDPSPNRTNTPKKLTIKGNLHFHLPEIHLPHLKTPHLNGKIFHGKGLKKLRAISKKRKQLRKSSSFQRRRQIHRLLNSKWAMAIMVISTLFLIYIDDFMMACAAPDNTISYSIISIIKIVVFLVFVVEMSAQIFVQRLHYLISFYFVIDLVSIASLVPDIIGFIFGIRSIVHAINALSLGRTARVARIASRLSRVARIINFFTLSRKRAVEEENAKMQLATEPSSIGRKLLNKSTHKVVVMVLLLILITSLTSISFNDDQYYHSILDLFVQQAANGTNSPLFQSTLSSFLGNSDNVDLLYLRVVDTQVYKSSIDTSDWFAGYIIKSTIDGDKNEIWINNKHNEQVTAALGITLTTCVILVLCFGTLLMSRDFQILVIKPIERMVGLIKRISSMDRYDGSDRDSEADTEDITNTTDLGSDPESGADDYTSGYGSDHEYDSIGGFDDEHETNIIGDVLSEILTKKMENLGRHKQVIEVQTQFTTGMHSLACAAAAYMVRKKMAGELKMYKKRANIINEIMNTEQSYIAALSVAIEAYLIPMRSSGLVSVDQLSTIFGNIEVLCQFHKDFHAKLEERVKAWHISQSIADLLLPLESGILDIYTVYINNYNDVMKALEEVRKDEKVADFMMELRETKAKGVDILTYLITPIQRVPRLVLLMDEVCKNTPVGHFELDSLLAAARGMKRATTLLNERKREAENKNTIQDIYMKLQPPIPEILIGGNSLFIQSKLKQDGDKFIFIFLATGIIKAEKNGSELEVKQYLPINVSISVTLIQDAPSIKIVNAFQLKVDDQYLLLFAKTSDLRKEWVDAVASLTKLQASRTKSMQLLNLSKRSSGRGSPSMSYLGAPQTHRSSISSGSGSSVFTPLNITSGSNSSTRLVGNSGSNLNLSNTLNNNNNNTK